MLIGEPIPWSPPPAVGGDWRCLSGAAMDPTARPIVAGADPETLAPPVAAITPVLSGASQ
jgi:hypothetical protein